MCFSATTSFAIGSLLSITGVALALQTKAKKVLPLTLIPLFFGLQQLSEGVLWLYIPDHLNDQFATLFKNIFLFFAFIFWPIWIPLSLLLVEKKPSKKIIHSICLGIGICIAVLLGLIIPNVQNIPSCFSIHYTLNYSELSPKNTSLFLGLNYLFFLLFWVATIVPLFISSLKKMPILGVLSILSALTILWINAEIFISMWCFFAAVISAGLFIVLKKYNRNLLK